MLHAMQCMGIQVVLNAGTPFPHDILSAVSGAARVSLLFGHTGMACGPCQLSRVEAMRKVSASACSTQLQGSYLPLRFGSGICRLGRCLAHAANIASR